MRMLLARPWLTATLVFWGREIQTPLNRERFVSRQCSTGNGWDEGALRRSLSSTYELNGTIGVLNWFQSHRDVVDSRSPDDWIHIILDESTRNKGKAAAILNALIGSCCLPTHDKQRAELANQLIQRLRGRTTGFTPDIVTLCLAYQAIQKNYPDLASEIMYKIEAIYSNSNIVMDLSETWKEDLEGKFGIPVLYDCSDFAIIDKPSGMCLTNKNQSGDECLQEILQKVGMSLSNLNDTRGFVHRLDKGTSGCLIVAKHNKAHAEWIARFFLRQVVKSYTCLVETSSQPQQLPQNGMVTLRVNGQPATSYYDVVENYGRHGAMLSVHTNQGRKHQVRIHCSKGLGTPIILDPRYGGERLMYQISSEQMKEGRAHGRICLHADSICIPELNLAVAAPLPLWWDGIVADIIAINQQ